MPLTVSFDPSMAEMIEAAASRNGLTAAEYVMRVVAEAIADAYDYERCADRIDAYEKEPVSYPHEEIMKEFGLRQSTSPHGTRHPITCPSQMRRTAEGRPHS